MGRVKTNKIQPPTSANEFSISTGDGTKTIVIAPNGYIGIGTQFPSAALDVVGNIRCSSQPTVAADVARKDYVDRPITSSDTPVGTTIVLSLTFGAAYPSTLGFSKPINSNSITIPTGNWTGVGITRSSTDATNIRVSLKANANGRYILQSSTANAFVPFDATHSVGTFMLTKIG